MCSQEERSLENLPKETCELRQRLEKLLPPYVAALERLRKAPEEFSRRFWASRVDELLGKVKLDYQNYQAQARVADLFGKFTVVAVDIALKAAGIEPIEPPASLQICISISETGKIEPAVVSDSFMQADVILISFEELEKLTLMLKDEILKGEITLGAEDEIPKLIRDLALGHT